MKVTLRTEPVERVAADVTVIVVASDALTGLRRMRAAGPAVLADLERQGFKGAEGTSAMLRGGGRRPRHFVAVGVGATAESTRESFRRAGSQLVARARELKARTVAATFLTAPATLQTDRPWAIGALVEGALLASYAFTEYRRDGERVLLGSLALAGLADARDRRVRTEVRHAETLAGATNEARGWINLPAAVFTPRAFGDAAEAVAGAAGLEVRVDGPKAIAALGMGALLAVASGSVEEPRFIRVTYRGGGSRRIALVGKGITFDSGGLSLKPASGMEHMKRDMAGGAAVLGAMRAIAALAPAVEVRAYIPASENLPGGSAMKPGDVLRAASGTTIEVLNTDAEGRLVLADALAVATRDRPDAIVDIATLTGAVRSALGARVAGIMGNDPALVAALVAAGDATGERLWELPLVPAYRADLESTVADLRNVAAEGHGGAIHAGLFLEAFVARRPWAHLDIAGVAFTERELPYTPRGAVGWGVRLLTQYVLAAAG